MELPDKTPYLKLQFHDTPNTPATVERRRTKFDRIQSRPSSERSHFFSCTVSYYILLMCFILSYLAWPAPVYLIIILIGHLNAAESRINIFVYMYTYIVYIYYIHQVYSQKATFIVLNTLRHSVCIIFKTMTNWSELFV